MNWKPHFDKDIAFHAATAHAYDGIVVTPREAMNRLLFEPFLAQITGGERMLDIGCGTGHSIRRFGPRYRSVTGVDHSAEMLACAAENLSVAGIRHATLIRQDAFIFLKSLVSDFDLVTAIGFLHHLPAETLGELLRLTADRVAPGGLLMVAEPIAIDVTTQPEEIVRWNQASVAAGVDFDTEVEEADEAPIEQDLLEKSLENAGLSVLRRQRAWELFPHHLPPSERDLAEIARLHGLHGDSGNVLCLLCRKPEG